QPKQLLDWEGLPLITHIADIAWAAGLDPVIVVVGAHAEAVGAALASRPVQIVRNYRWDEGVSTSLHVGIAAVPQNVEAAIFIPVDQPLITPQLLQALVHRSQEIARKQGKTGRGIVVPRDQSGRRGTPVLFGRTYFPELARLSGDVGGRALFEKYSGDLDYLTITDPRELTDVDTPEAYERLKRGCASSTSDTSSAEALDFGQIRGLICDMDGVLWRGDAPLPGLEAFFRLIDKHNLAYVLVTNNSSRTPADYVGKLAGMGITTTPDHVLNSAIAAARYVADIRPGATVYAIGGPGIKDALVTHGLTYSNDDDIAEADVVVVGWDRQLTWRKLATATRLILAGATFVGTNPDRTYPLEEALAPGNGAQTAALEAATGVRPVIAGKPSRLLYEQAMTRMGTTPETTLVIGDRLDTDILGGVRLGMPTALVLTGISQIDELQISPIRPTVVVDDLPSLVRAWEHKPKREADHG
ncbi:MAG: HAD-IIA family hydrolase, partial [Anaerolineae bacterium]|nr:HAD-IIA family hydrolase [Anaerolineae bacterium]